MPLSSEIPTYQRREHLAYHTHEVVDVEIK
jgi:hypothetical protein